MVDFAVDDATSSEKAETARRTARRSLDALVPGERPLSGAPKKKQVGKKVRSKDGSAIVHVSPTTAGIVSTVSRWMTGTTRS
jgi:hypothetical protein